MPQKYMNPITIEAELFANSLESLSKTYNNIDDVLLYSLEKVMNTIEQFLESNSERIVATQNTKLIRCPDFTNIKKIYTCSSCKQDIGRSVGKVGLHLIEQCSNRYKAENVKSETLDCRKRLVEPKKLRDELKKENNPKKNSRSKIENSKLPRKVRSLLTCDMNEFIENNFKISSKLKCLPSYDIIERDLSNVMKPLFPDEVVKIYKFGSRIAGTGNRESDLDFYIDIGDVFNVYQNRVDNDTLLKINKVGQALSNNPMIWKGLVKIEKARVPILKVYHVTTGIECDINFSNSLGTINTKYLEYIFNLQPIAQLLCIFMKKWLQSIKFNEEINTYSINLMVIFYLQTVEAVPSMEQLQANISEEKALQVGPWVCTHAILTLKELNISLERLDQPNLLKFVRGFFIYYGNFNFARDVICPYLGKVVKKTDVESLMPERYIDYVESSPESTLECEKPLVVQDPIQLNHNTTKRIVDSTAKIFKTHIVSSLEIIKDNFL